MKGPVFIKTDGSARGESHPNGVSTGIGYVIENNGTTVSTGNETITNVTESSSVAEYIALERALEKVLDLGHSGFIFIKTDSNNLVNLIKGNSSPRTDETATWISRIKSQLNYFEGYSISKTNRSFTEDAHNLANKAHR